VSTRGGKQRPVIPKSMQDEKQINASKF
jgi:hypothetical protein